MSGIHYVYVNPTLENDTRGAQYAPGGIKYRSLLLTFRSRWDSDELFRGLQAIKMPDGASRFTTLERVNPQFWCYDTIPGDSWLKIVRTLDQNALNHKFVSVFLANSNAGREWPILTNPTIGPDWVSGKTFYIRNRREPNLYWHYERHQIVISTDRRTRFRIKDEDYEDERVLIRKDKVTIEPVGSLGTPIGMYVTKNGNGENLSVRPTREVWTFSDLFDSVGVTWSISGTQFATSLPDLGDEWELC
ncbi:hypothetical protein B9Z19DRAFT_1084450 [Tuber borchii]|uniref:Uncharacterized protein n=1 Tax=Tuber borchii TaxID=42251 RepID=A0A2T6ZS36_TUBBO|nr:hypothetical protein B9Z19DRAFT_1084450 [Tuber borchii]